jgi:hypothetical protein
LTEARDEGLDDGGDASLRGNEPCLDKGCSPLLVFCPRFGGLSDTGEPQAVSPPRSIKLRRARWRYGRYRDGCSGRGIFSGFSDNAGDDSIKKRGPRTISHKKYLLIVWYLPISCASWAWFVWIQLKFLSDRPVTALSSFHAVPSWAILLAL